MTEVVSSNFQVSYFSFISFSVGSGLEDESGLEDRSGQEYWTRARRTECGLDSGSEC